MPPILKRLARNAIKALAILLALCGVSPGGSHVSADHTRQAVVTVERLNLRPAPGMETPPIGTLQRGEIVIVLEETDEWWKVKAKKRIGYVSRQEKFLSFVPPPAPADGTGTDEEKRRAAEALQRQISHQEKTVAATARKEARVVDRLEQAARALADTRRHLGRLRDEIDRLGRRIEETSEASRALEEKIRREAEYIKRRLVALYKLGRYGNLQLLASAQSISELQRRQRALTAILDYDRRMLAEYDQKATLLADLGADLARSRERKQALLLEAEAAGQAAAREEGEKRRLLEKIRSEKSLELAALEGLKQAARELDRAMTGLQPQSPPPISLPSGGKTPFEDAKGLLKLPVSGKIRSFYGTYRHPTFKVTNFNGGIDIQAGQGEPVTAVWQGVVVFSDWFRGYGNMIIVDHGDSYHTLYAHLADRFKQKGEPVEKGEVIGTVGETGPVKDPGLHFEVRHHGKAIDPFEWIRKG